MHTFIHPLISALLKESEVMLFLVLMVLCFAIAMHLLTPPQPKLTADQLAEMEARAKAEEAQRQRIAAEEQQALEAARLAEAQRAPALRVASGILKGGLWLLAIGTALCILDAVVLHVASFFAFGILGVGVVLTVVGACLPR